MQSKVNVSVANLTVWVAPPLPLPVASNVCRKRERKEKKRKGGREKRREGVGFGGEEGGGGGMAKCIPTPPFRKSQQPLETEKKGMRNEAWNAAQNGNWGNSPNHNAFKKWTKLCFGLIW